MKQNLRSQQKQQIGSIELRILHCPKQGSDGGVGTSKEGPEFVVTPPQQG